MTTISTQKLGGTGTALSANGHPDRTYHGVIDIAAAVADGYVKGDSLALITIPANVPVLHFGARITEALVIGTNGTTDIGTTVGDPDEFVDAQTTTAVGNFGAYAATTLAASDSERTLYAEFNSDTSVTSGKIAYTVTMPMPPVEAPGRAVPRTYPN